MPARHDANGEIAASTTFPDPWLDDPAAARELLQARDDDDAKTA